MRSVTNADALDARQAADLRCDHDALGPVNGAREWCFCA
jgi:hypothetical protein